MNYRFLSFLLSAVTLSAAPIKFLSHGFNGFGTSMSSRVTEANDSLALMGPAASSPGEASLSTPTSIPSLELGGSHLSVQPAFS
jgi:hypothetical protein